MTEEETDEYPDVEDLQVDSIIAFNGKKKRLKTLKR